MGLTRCGLALLHEQMLRYFSGGGLIFHRGENLDFLAAVLLLFGEFCGDGVNYCAVIGRALTRIRIPSLGRRVSNACNSGSGPGMISYWNL